jgi:DNA-binding protein YbaB
MSIEPRKHAAASSQQVRVQQSSADGAVTVAVDLEGHVVDLQLADVALQRPAGQLAHDILTCIRAAQATFS